MLGANDIEAAQIDCLTEHVRDIKEKYSKIRAVTDAAEKEVQMTKWFETEFAEWLTKVVTRLCGSHNHSIDNIITITNNSCILTGCTVTSPSSFIHFPEYASCCLLTVTEDHAHQHFPRIPFHIYANTHH